MRERADDFGIVFAARPPYQARATRWLAADEMLLLERVAYLVDRLYNTGGFRRTLTALAALYDSPFGMYRDLVGDSAGMPSSRSWEGCAEFIIRAITARFTGKKGFFLDALRWDWCAGTRTHRYPAALRPDRAADITKHGWSFFRERAEGETVRYQGAEFRIADLEKTVFFRAESDEFTRAYMQGRRCAAFIPGKEVLLFD